MALGDEVVVRNDPDDEPEEAAEEEEEADLIDPVDAIREKCGKNEQIEKYEAVLKECNDRVSQRPDSGEDCHEEMIDYIHALDHCVSHQLFSKLK